MNGDQNDHHNRGGAARSDRNQGDPRGRPDGVRVLIIRPGAIGDVLLAFPVLRALREQYAGCQIMLVSNVNVLPLALAFGVADEVSDYQDSRWSELFSTGGIRNPAIRELLQNTELAICWLHDVDGVVQYNLEEAGVKRIVIAPGRPHAGERIHIVEYLARTVGVQGVGVQFVAPSLSVDAVSEDALHAYVAIHPGSGGAQKCWPVACFAAVIERLWQQQHPILLLAGPADSERVRELLRLLSSPPRAEMLKVLTNASLLEVARVLQRCRCYLGNDSGITHLAAMLGVPTVAIFGPSDPAVWRPVGPFTKVIRERVLEQVSVDAVLEAIKL